MTGIKPSSHGIVVDHKESGVRYAVSDRNYNEKIHRKVRDLKPGETVLAYQPKRLPGSEPSETFREAVSGTTGEQAPASASSGSSDSSKGTSTGSPKATPTEGSASAGTQG